jgi:hypothetical protein
MRTLGALFVLLGLLAFFYCGSQLSAEAPVPEGLTITQSLQYPAGRLEMGRYAGIGVAAIGFLLALFPKGR